ncbi:berberine bridge enzyme-like Cyn d 4 [Hordeum vulgare subsp. vulgare]|uniref:berberine bridge enzyme-like Cyn d 4 n=1 Tax=Hordeum vulgare subsp. vulgare TaxID=112509 RepID=UPI001D1A4391|nr:berberine bridge enzyme-like Cyn d 4 [Hordeum vulgare subsp. vulgare]
MPRSSMAPSRIMALLAMLLVSRLFFCSQASSHGFLECVTTSVPGQLLFTRSSPSFASVLASSVRNRRFLTQSTVRPLCVVTATSASHVQAAVVCGRRHGVRLRVRSGGHDYEGLSFRSACPETFAVIDLAGLRAVRVSLGSPLEGAGAPATAWVDSGATLGELYYGIGKASDRLAFPAGLCPTVGVGGHLSGGGFGMLLRKHGLAADHVVDATMVDAEGRILDGDAMGRDVFWAIRGGGGGGSFGIVLSWRVMLVAVPPKVTAFTVHKSVEQGAVDMLTKWQEVAPALPDDLFVRVLVQRQVAKFQALYLGTCDALLPVMRRRFPEFGMNRTHCKEMTWLQSVPYIYLGIGATVEDILNRTDPVDATSSKATSDYVRHAIARDVWEEIFATWFARPDAGLMILDPYGGNMARVPEAATPFPHRAGVLYNIQYMNFWTAAGDGAAQTAWIRGVYAFMEPHVSKNPREAYVNYRDLDLGANVVVGNVTSYEAGKVWGEKYYKDNFRRLAMAKRQIDPDDYFRNEQSIPPLDAHEQRLIMRDVAPREWKYISFRKTREGKEQKTSSTHYEETWSNGLCQSDQPDSTPARHEMGPARHAVLVSGTQYVSDRVWV